MAAAGSERLYPCNVEACTGFVKEDSILLGRIACDKHTTLCKCTGEHCYSDQHAPGGCFRQRPWPQNLGALALNKCKVCSNRHPTAASPRAPRNPPGPRQVAYFGQEGGGTVYSEAAVPSKMGVSLEEFKADSDLLLDAVHALVTQAGPLSRFIETINGGVLAMKCGLCEHRDKSKPDTSGDGYAMALNAAIGGGERGQRVTSFLKRLVAASALCTVQAAVALGLMDTAKEGEANVAILLYSNQELLQTVMQSVHLDNLDPSHSQLFVYLTPSKITDVAPKRAPLQFNQSAIAINASREATIEWAAEHAWQGAAPAPADMFSHVGGIPKAGQKLEAYDIKSKAAKAAAEKAAKAAAAKAAAHSHLSLICVATVQEVDSATGKLLIHFDGWSSDFDYWCEPSSQHLHPVGYCKSVGHELQPPKGHVGPFIWDDYLQLSESAAKQNFAKKQPRCSQKSETEREMADRVSPLLLVSCSPALVDGLMMPGGNLRNYGPVDGRAQVGSSLGMLANWPHRGPSDEGQRLVLFIAGK